MSAYSVLWETKSEKGENMIFQPTLWIKSVLKIDRELLDKYDFKGLILDLDNTLSMHGNPAEEEGVTEWLDYMRELGVKMVVVSNNNSKRVKPLAEKLGLPYIANGWKPLPFGIARARRYLGLPRRNIAVVGDQIFTDVLGGNGCKIRTILVEPFHLENKWTFKLKRKVESLIFDRDFSKLDLK